MAEKYTEEQRKAIEAIATAEKLSFAQAEKRYKLTQLQTEELESQSDILLRLQKIKSEDLEYDKQSFDWSKKTTAEIQRQVEYSREHQSYIKLIQKDLSAARKEQEDASNKTRDASAKAAGLLAEKTKAAGVFLDAGGPMKLTELDKEYNALRRNEESRFNQTDLGKELIDITKELNRLTAEGADMTTDAVKAMQQRKTALETGRDADIANALASKEADIIHLKNLKKEADIADENYNRALGKQNLAEQELATAQGKVTALEQELAEQQQIAQQIKQNIAGLNQVKLVQDKIDQVLGNHVKYYNLVRSISVRGAQMYFELIKAGTDILMVGFERFKEIDSVIGEFRKETGLTRDMTEDMYKSVQRISTQLARFGVTAKDVADSSRAFTDEFQVAGLISDEILGNVAMMGKNLGVSAEDTAKIYSRFNAAAEAAGMTADGMMAVVAHASNLAKVAPSKVLKDMANASEDTLKFIGKTPEKLMIAAIQARKLGTTVNELSKSARGFLNYQDSITSELEASALVGKSLNFQASREAAYNRDILKSRQLALQEIEKLGDFNELSVYQQESVAKAAQMTVEEITKQQNQQKMLNALKQSGNAKDMEMARKYESLVNGLNKKQKQTTEEIQKQAREFVRQQQIQTEINKITTAYAGIIAPLKDGLALLAEKILPPIANFMQSIADRLSKMSDEAKMFLGIFASIVAGGGIAFGVVGLVKIYKSLSQFSKIPSILKDVAQATQTMATSTKAATETASGLGEALKGTASAAGGPGGAAESVKKVGGSLNFISFADIGKAALMLGILAAAIWALGHAFKSWKDVNTTDVLVGIMGLVGGLAAMGAAMALSAKVTVPALLIVGGALGILAGSMYLAGTGFKNITEGIKNLKEISFTGLLSNFKDLAIAMKPFNEFIGSKISPLVQSFGKFGEWGENIRKFKEHLDGARTAYSDFAQAVSKNAIKEIQLKMTTAIEVKNLDVLKETIQKLIDALTTLGAGTSPVVNVNNSQEAIIKKLDEMITAMKNGEIAVYLDTHKVNRVLAGGSSN
jgi:hypothetical protein